MRVKKKLVRLKGGERKRMKLRAIYTAVFVATLLVSIPWVRAPTGPDWSRTGINSGYGVTTNYHGIEVPLETEVTAYAGTTNVGDIDHVKFRWLPPDGSDPIVITGTHSGSDTTWSGGPIEVWTSTYEPDEVGDWGVQAIFYDQEGHGRGPLPQEGHEKIAIRAQSFYAVPEVATIAAILAMFGALGLFAIKKKRPSIRTPL